MSDPLARVNESSGDGTLFAPPKQIHVPIRRGRKAMAATSKRLPNDRSDTDRTLIFNMIELRPMTLDEIAAALGKFPSSVSPRLTELREAGKIEHTGETRPTRSGRNAAVWRAVAGGAA
ncbi:MAG: winged helix-turn-helix transcriptional regulator [Anaerolineae bacterium]|nr:winged helix-turn-helix transcriptional regulator [Phycisphaerae bacterium]